MNKRFCNALVFALCLPLASLALAEGRPGGSSFKGGFSSQKSTAARNSAAPKQPSFGSFGARRADSAPPRSADAGRGSAMSRDMDRRAAQDRAMRNWDARRDAGAGTVAGAGGGSTAGRSASAAPPLPPLNPVPPGGASAGRNDGWRGDSRTADVGSGGGTGSGGYGYRQPNNGPVIVRERSGSNAWLWGLGGYVLGHSAISHAGEAPPASTSGPAGTASPAPDAAARPHGGASGPSAFDSLNASADAAIATGSAGSADTASAAAQPEASGRHADRAHERDTIRTLTWLLLPFAFVLLLYFTWKHLKTSKKHANYAFERN